MHGATDFPWLPVMVINLKLYSGNTIKPARHMNI
jgi:hypothetical protein